MLFQNHCSRIFCVLSIALMTHAAAASEANIQRYLAQAIAADARGEAPPSGVHRIVRGEKTVYSVDLVLRADRTRVGQSRTIAELTDTARRAQARALSAMDPGLNAQIIHRYETLPVLAAELSAEQIRRMAQNPYISDIVPVTDLELQWSEAQELTGITALAEGPEGLTGAGTVIAVIDNVFDTLHPSLGGAPFPNAKVIGGVDTGDGDDDPSKAPGSTCASSAQENGHATFVSAIAAGVDVVVDEATTGGVRLRGAAPGASLVAVKLYSGLSQPNTPTDCSRAEPDGDPSALLAGLDWIAANRDEHGIDVTTISVAVSPGPVYFSDDPQTCATDWPNIDMAYENLRDLGVISFSAAGSPAASSSMVFQDRKRRAIVPACLPSVMSVSSTYAQSAGGEGDDCDVGLFEHCNLEIADTVDADHVQAYVVNPTYLDLLAPGIYQVQARTTHFDPPMETGPQSVQCSLGGTSFASPNAAGIAALMIEKAERDGLGELDLNAMRKLLTSTGCCVADSNTDPVTINPRVNALSAALRLDEDVDDDGSPDLLDNCIDRANASQLDTDGDGYGNACDADFNGDGTVNPIDLGVFRMAFFGSPGDDNWNPDADFNGDQAVNVVDLGIIRELYFNPPGPAAQDAMPAPCSFSSLGGNCGAQTAACTPVP